MKLINSIIVLVLCGSLVACSPSKDGANVRQPATPEVTAAANAAAKVVPGEVSVSELSSWIADKQAVAVDANGASVRAEFGSIPGAVLLSNYKTYEVSELPAKDTKLVFYCSNEQCGASHAAAAKAAAAGYSKVAVLPAGIMGWKKAGQETSTVQ